MERFKRRGVAVTACAFALFWSGAAKAQMGEGELLARLSWIVLVLVGLVQTIVAAGLRSHLTRGRATITAWTAFVTLVAGLFVEVLGEGAHFIGVMFALLAFLPGLPLAIDLSLQKAWAMIVVAFLLPAALGALVILDGAWR